MVSTRMVALLALAALFAVVLMKECEADMPFKEGEQPLFDDLKPGMGPFKDRVKLRGECGKNLCVDMCTSEIQEFIGLKICRREIPRDIIGREPINVSLKLEEEVIKLVEGTQCDVGTCVAMRCQHDRIRRVIEKEYELQERVVEEELIILLRGGCLRGCENYVAAKCDGLKFKNDPCNVRDCMTNCNLKMNGGLNVPIKIDLIKNDQILTDIKQLLPEKVAKIQKRKPRKERKADP